MPRRRPWIILALAVGLFARVRPALAQDPSVGDTGTDGTTAATNVTRGMAYYDAGQFKECAASLEAALDERRARELDPRETERARVY